MKQPKFINIQALRGIAVLCVVLFHLLSIEAKYGGGACILPDWLDFGQFGVDLFFVISGFVMVVVTRDKIGGAFHFLYHRVTRIYPLYWIYSLLLLAVYWFRPDWVIGSHNREIDVWASLLLLPQNDYPLLSVGWTLIHELYFYTVFFVMLLFASPGKRVIFLLSWGGIVFAMDVSGHWGGAASKLIFNPLTVEFLAGCLIAQYSRHLKISDLKILVLLVLGVLSASIYGYLGYRNLTGSVGMGGWWRILIFGLPASCIVLLAVCAEHSHFFMYKYLRTLGDASYSIYLTHILTLAILGKIWSVFSSPLTWDNWIVMPLLLMAALGAGYASYKWIETPMLKVSKGYWAETKR